jgi:hypothetical protein
MPASSSSTSPSYTPDHDIRDQPFVAECFSLSTIAKITRNHLIEGLDEPSMDVDRWEVVMSPQEYLRRFKDTLATIQLVNRIPLRPLHTTYHRGPAFDRWLLLAEANHQIWINPKHKHDFFSKLEEYHTVQAGRIMMQASVGKAHVSTAVFVRCLVQAGCQTIRLKEYGQKMPIERQFMKSEPAEVNHQWAEHNEWDLGKTFTSPHIWLFGSKSGRQHGFKRYPMAVPCSLDYGSVNLDVKHDRQNFTVKIYPRIVHVIKSFNSSPQSNIPRTLSGVRNQVAAAARMLHNLTGKDESSLGGFRIEVTVKARSLQDATARINRTNFLEPSYWLGHGPGPHARKIVSARLLPRQAFLDNALWVQQQATDLKVFLGDNNARPTSQQLRVLTDILNAVGWNNGLRSPSKSLEPKAWWNHDNSRTDPTLYQSLCEICQTDNDIKDLFGTARSMVGSIPCQRHPNNIRHRYQINNTAPFRLRCCFADCYHKLQRTAIIQWIAVLASEEVIDGEALLQKMRDGA